jgi:hypothetical protein
LTVPDFALNIDPAKNWPSIDSSDQESNFMVFLLNENVVHLTVQIYTIVVDIIRHKEMPKKGYLAPPYQFYINRESVVFNRQLRKPSMVIIPNG